MKKVDLLKNVKMKKIEQVKDKLKSDNDFLNIDYSENYSNIADCPYCGGISIEEKSNGYIFCEDCGVNIEKR